MTTALLLPQTSRARLREILAFSTGFYYSGVNTGTASDAVTDAAIPRWDTGRLTNIWTLITSGNRVGESRRVQGVASTTATLVAALSGALANGDTFEFLPYDPDIMHYAIQEACATVWPKAAGNSRTPRGLYRDVVEYVVVDNLIDNPFFESSESTGAITAFATYDSTVEGATLVEDAGHGLTSGDIITISGTTNYNGTWRITVVSSSEFWIQTPFIADDATGTWREGYSSQAGTASGWTATSGTWTFPTSTRAWLGRHVASAAGAATLTQNIFAKVNFADAVGKTLHIRGAVRSATADIARLRISFDGGSTFAASSPYHLGGGDWERPSTHAIDVAIPSTATTMTIYCDVAAGATPNFGGVWAWIDPIADYRLPDGFASNDPRMVSQQVYEDRTDLFRPLWGRATPGHILKLEGIGPLSVPTSDVMITQVSEHQAELLIAEAAVHMYRRLKGDRPGDAAKFAAEEDSWQRRADTLRGQLGRNFPPANERGWWNIPQPGLLHLDR